MSDKDIKRELEELEAQLDATTARVNITVATTDMILQRANRILYLLLQRNTPTGMVINQIGGNTVSTLAGGTSTFQEVPTPLGSAFPTGTTFSWTVDDTADISLAPSADGTQVTATCVASPTGAAYNLTCTSNFTPAGAPTPVSATINVPIIVGTPTPTGMQINQLS